MSEKSIEIIDHEKLMKAYVYRLSMKESQKKYNKSHKEKINEIRRRCYQNKVINDPDYKAKKALKAKEYYHRKKAELNKNV
jgi:hypothetical protein